MVFIPIFTLEGIEGKTFRPMAQTVGFAILGSLILSLTYVPMMCNIFLKNVVHDENSFAEKGLFYFKNSYKKLLDKCLNNSKMVIGVALLIFVLGVFYFKIWVQSLFRYSPKAILQ